MNYPDLLSELYCIHNPERIPPETERDLKHSRAEVVRGFRKVGLPTFQAAIVRAVRQIVCASLGNFSKSRNAALIHETGRVLGGSAIHSLCCQF